MVLVHLETVPEVCLCLCGAENMNQFELPETVTGPQPFLLFLQQFSVLQFFCEVSLRQMLLSTQTITLRYY